MEEKINETTTLEPKVKVIDFTNATFREMDDESCGCGSGCGCHDND